MTWLPLGSSPLARGLPILAVVAALTWWIIPARAGFTGKTDQPHTKQQDHPRSRGVYVTPGHDNHVRNGSSPLARGLRPASRSASRLGRIIPARAGFTRKRSSSSRCAEDHPRSRGVYGKGANRFYKLAGSSPLARGLQLVGPSRQLAHRIIPARAGFTDASRMRRPGIADHPRSRGVYDNPVSSLARWRGSSPLARGLLHEGVLPEEMGGIIPARAGFTAAAASECHREPDHPRSRGVYEAETVPSPVGWGSSPLARGLLQFNQNEFLEERIIPARAGFTRLLAGRSVEMPDHPRSRGVYSAYSPVSSMRPGSSPLARGLPSCWSCRSLSVVDHPRSRGVYNSRLRTGMTPCGSSPLARGLLYDNFFLHHWSRIIPARAGFTCS